jgi:hypothetical protein
MCSHSGENILFRIRPTLSQRSSCNRSYLPLKGNAVILLDWISRFFEVGERKKIELEWKAFFELWSCNHSWKSEGPKLDSADAGLTKSHNESCAYHDRCQWSLEHCNDQNRGLTSPHLFDNEQFRLRHTTLNLVGIKKNPNLLCFTSSYWNWNCKIMKQIELTQQFCVIRWKGKSNRSKSGNANTGMTCIFQMVQGSLFYRLSPETMNTNRASS